MEKLVTFQPSATAKPDVYYPESDGQPMGETQFHVTAILYLYQALQSFFQKNDEVYVAADMLFYYEEGNPSAFKVPDVFAVKGVSKHMRRTYKLWEEGVGPCTVFEMTSRSTWLEDLGDKRALYETLGVPEYFLFDPEDEYLSPRFQGFELVEGHYRPMTPAADGTLYSHSLGVILQPDGSMLRVVDPASRDIIPTLAEAVERTQRERERAQAEAERAQAEAERAQTETEKAQAEARRADAAEQKLAELQAELKRLKVQTSEDDKEE